MTILLLDPYFKIKGWIYRGILGVLVKNSLNLIPFLQISSNFGVHEWKFEVLREYRGMRVLSYSFNFLLLKLLNKGMYFFSFVPLKLSNKGREKYFKIILFIHFHSISFHSLLPNDGLGSVWLGWNMNDIK